MDEHIEFNRLANDEAGAAQVSNLALIQCLTLVKIANQLERLVNLAEAAGKEGGEA